MSVRIWIGSEYENVGESRMMSDVIHKLRETLEALSGESHILCNFCIPGFPSPKGRKYFSHIDMAVLRNRQLVILELKNYQGTIQRSVDGSWHCDSSSGERIEIKGGKEGRTPEQQVCDYRKQLISLLTTEASHFLRKRGTAFDFKRYVSGCIVFPDISTGSAAAGIIVSQRPLWLNVVRLGGLAEALCQAGGGRDVVLDDYEIACLVSRVLKLVPAKMVGNLPMLAAEDQSKSEVSPQKVITVKVVEEKFVQTREEYGAIASVWNSDDSVHEKAQQFVKLFKRFIWNKIRSTYKETAVNSVYSGIINLFRGDAELLKHANRLRRLGNAIADGTCMASAADVDEAFKTLCQMICKFYGQEIPEMLAADCAKIRFRDQARFEVSSKTPLAVLVEITSIDVGQHVFACVSVEGAEQKELRVRYSDGNDDFANFADYAHPGDRVCLVTPIQDGEWLKASEIVLEPDFLISPQKMGSAFTYARSDVYFWLSLFEDEAKKAKNVPGKEPLTMEQCQLRGDFANMCLADYCAGWEQDSRAKHKAFFKSNPMKLEAANPGELWVKDCLEQDANLKRFIGSTIPQEHGIRPGRWQIEAPLYSPIYGLSARADAICYAPDGKSATVLELKSGKWDNFKGHRPKVEHAVQPIFYGDLLYFSLGISRDAVNQLLCYAKTIPADNWNAEKPGKLFTRAELERVMPGGMIGRALRCFVKVRNEIIAMGDRVRKGTFREVVDGLCPESFRAESMGDKLWNGFMRPELAALLQPLQSADELAKRYFYRQLSFIAEEEFLSRLGEKGVDIGRGGNSALWRTTVADRQKAGLRLSELLVSSTKEDEIGRVIEIEFDTSRHQLNKGCSIRAGDSVCIYKSRGGNENVTNTIIFAADVKEVHPCSVVLSLQDPQPECLFGFDESAVFAVEPAPSSYMASGYAGLRYFLSGDERRRRLVLNETSPSDDPTRQLPIPERELTRRYPGISTVLTNAWKAKDWFLLWGPPGTGKTSTAMRALVDMAMAKPDMKVLLLAYTYRATDEICRMLECRLKDVGLSTDLYLRLGNPLKCDPSLRGRIADEMNFENRTALADYVSKVRIVVGPVFAALPDKPVFSIFGHFDLAIVDEASQLLDTHILPVFCAKGLADNRPLVDKFIFIGDDRQLPAVVQQEEKTSRVEDPLLREKGIVDCRHSFFQRLKVIAGDKEPDPRYCGMLERQFRMHPKIAEFCNFYFYDGKLENGDRPHQTSDLPELPTECVDPFERYVLSARLGFIPTEVANQDVDVKVNTEEARVCVNIIKTLTRYPARSGSENTLSRSYQLSEIGIIVPFRNQIAKVRSMIDEELGDGTSDEILIDTVERFQGGERPVIIFSTVIQNLYQADMISATRYDETDDDRDEDAVAIDRKLNVAVTRARERFYIVGKETVLRGLRAYGELIEWISCHDGICDLEKLLLWTE